MGGNEMGLSESIKRDQALSRRISVTKKDENATAIRLWRVVPIAVTVTTVANVVFYFILTRWLGEPLLMIKQSLPLELVPMPVDEVILFSIIWALGAGLVYTFLNVVTTRADRSFIIISALVLLASFALPLKIPTPPVAMSAKLSLAAMHLIGAVIVVASLIGLNPRRSR
jgi:hypothetical protein